jgi:2'-5' RNA ligase
MLPVDVHLKGLEQFGHSLLGWVVPGQIEGLHAMRAEIMEWMQTIRTTNN